MVDQPTEPGLNGESEPWEPGATGNGAGGETRSTHETRRATGMGVPGTFPDEGGPVDRARRMASGKLEETAHRVRSLGDQAATRNKLLGRTRPLAYTAADGIDSAADYVRTRELEEMRTDLETQVRRHPLASVAVAFFAGYTLRRLF